MLFFNKTPATRTTSAAPQAGGRHSTALLPNSLRLLTFNMQAAICSSSFRDYFTGSWKHVLAHGGSLDTLRQIAALVHDYDIVSLQEVDGGSLRSRQVNQLRFLARSGDFGFWHQQLNRDLGRLGQFSNGVLSRVEPLKVENHRLPGLPGRGAIVSLYGQMQDPLVLVNVHLALGRKQRNNQLAYLSDKLSDYRRIVMMGDFNCSSNSLRRSPLAALGLMPTVSGMTSYPSWAPDRLLDHVLVSDAVEARHCGVLSDCRLSDHLPIAVEITL